MLTRSTVDAEAAAVEAARIIEATAAAAVADRGHFNFAVSGGRTPWRTLEILAGSRMNWSRTSLFQVDERIAPSGSPARNLTHLILTLPLMCQAAIRPMPVGSDDLEVAMNEYEYSMPDRFDLVHLGLGPDGHTASLIPDDPVLDVEDRLVAVTKTEYQGTRRMTLTYPAINAARRVLFLVTGDDKREALEKLLVADPSIPAGRVKNEATIIVTDVDLSNPVTTAR